MRFTQKVAVVTGGASGIGRACAIAFAREGARVAVVDRSLGMGRETAALIRERGGEAVFLQADVGVEEQIRTAIAQAAETWGGIDVLHCNAGVAVRNKVSEQDAEGWDRCIAANLRGVFLSSKYAIPYMLEKGGSIVHTSSVTGIVGMRNRAAYSATKGAMVALTRNMALDYAAFRIRVNCVCPGFTRTPLIQALLDDPDKAARLTKLHPLGRLGEPEDIASAVLFLASEEASWITGQALAVDGGFSAGVAVDM
jgi:NAD(P)-dependent dehydrogenase (short-subunit alcohol dehydrogenase family)